jgi:hypothetical protein
MRGSLCTIFFYLNLILKNFPFSAVDLYSFSRLFAFASVSVRRESRRRQRRVCRHARADRRRTRLAAAQLLRLSYVCCLLLIARVRHLPMLRVFMHLHHRPFQYRLTYNTIRATQRHSTFSLLSDWHFRIRFEFLTRNSFYVRIHLVLSPVLETCQRDAPPLFEMLRERYAPSLTRDPQFTQVQLPHFWPSSPHALQCYHIL